ncbi:sodium:solute symporter family transporter [Aeoliella mucimassa]|uniref:Sodium/glucose cotransporter n=1 Tax=Aeoliella mucimassa TaxID=2527972 RepID=A0A518AS69_9BACT|nr:transporter [Aeoliella mucimassa]QDU57569.1 Sodium/glucose cotransporter [Aeoliella mucimassa]
MHAIDYWVIALYLLSTTGLGIWLGRGQTSQTDFFLGGRELPAFALLLSIVATETSTVTFLSIPGKSFVTGGNLFYLQLAVGYIVGRLIVVAILLPLHFAGRPVTAYAIFEQRFGVRTRQAASAIFLLARTAGDGLRLFLTALALQQTIGWPAEVCVAVIAVVTGCYALFGGVKSVVWNDCLQFVVYTIGALIVLGMIVNRVPGGLSEIVQFANETGRSRLLDFSFDPNASHITFWSGLFGGAFLTLATHGADQLIVQRYLCAKNKRSAGWALALSGPLVMVQFAVFLCVGIGLACYFSHFDSARLNLAGDQALANFVVNDVGIGVRGVILAAVFAAAMSTLSSSVNSSASSLLDDLAAPWTRGMSDSAGLMAARVTTLFFTIAQAGVALLAYSWVTDMAIVDQVLAIAGFSAGLLLGLYFLGLSMGTAKSWQAIAALAVGGCVTGTALFNGVNGFWFPVIGSGTTLLTGVLLIKLSPSSSETVQS